MRLIKAVCAFINALKISKVYPQITVLSPNDLLKGRSALITGGTSGIGFEIAKAFINAGANVVITGRDQSRVLKACGDLSAITSQPEKVKGVVFDVTNIDGMAEGFDRACAVIAGKFDVLVNNAGVLGAHISNATEDEYDKVMGTNLKGVFFLCKLFARYMIDNGIQGNILNISSSSALRPAVSSYTLSKWGIRGLTLGLGRMFAPYGIVVNAIAPGQTATKMIQRENSNDLYADTVPIKRVALPIEIANMSVIMVSNLCRTVIGDTLYMTGGSGIVSNDDMSYDF